MPATTRDSVLYKKLHVDKFLGDARDAGGRAYPVPFQHTVVSGETGGASAGVQDLVNLCVLPANCMVVGWDFIREALGASAGAGVNLRIGDSGDDDRFMLVTDSDAAGGNNALAFAGQNFKPTADTIVQGKWSTASPVVGKIFKGIFWVIPGA